MIRRRSTRPPIWIDVAGEVDGVLGVGVFILFSGLSSVSVSVLVSVLGGVLGGVNGGVNGVDFVGGVVGVGVSVLGGVVILLIARGRGHSVRGRRPRPSGLPGGVGWLRVSLGGTMRRLLHACTSVDRLVDYLLDRTVDKLPAAVSARFAEEWQDHRTHYSGWRLVWWALCVRATALRTVAALGPARLPRDS
jgi:hypothetical protein